MNTLMKRLAGLTLALTASVMLFSPSAQAHASSGSSTIPCGIYNPDGLVYYGNCTSEDTLISISQPGLQPWTACVPAKSAQLLGDPNAKWIVKEIGSC